MLGSAAIYAGRTGSTCAAGLYYYSLWSYMIFLAVVLAIPYVIEDGNGSNQTTYMAFLLLLVRYPPLLCSESQECVLLKVVMPFFVCSPCAYCARVHFYNCARRDALLREFAVVGDEEIPYDALV